MSDELDSLSDAALSERVAVEVAGFLRTDDPDAFTDDASPRIWTRQNGVAYISRPYPIRYYEGKKFGHQWDEVNFATSADAVLPILERMEVVRSHRHAIHGKWRVEVMGYSEESTCHAAYGVTFARAACIALLRSERAKRAEKGGAL